MVKIKKSPLYLQVKEAILDLIADRYSPGDQLPPEAELMELFGVSRSTVREALNLLELQGIINKRHGRGNFVCSRDKCTHNRLHKIVSIPETIKAQGYTPRVKEVNISRSKSRDIVKKLELEKDSENLFVMERTYWADKMPAIYCRDYFPEDIIEEEGLFTKFKNSLIDFLARELNIVLKKIRGKLTPVLAGEIVAQKLEINVNSPIILLERKAYISEKRPLFITESYTRHDVITFCFERR